MPAVKDSNTFERRRFELEQLMSPEQRADLTPLSSVHKESFCPTS